MQDMMMFSCNVQSVENISGFEVLFKSEPM